MGFKLLNPIEFESNMPAGIYKHKPLTEEHKRKISLSLIGIPKKDKTKYKTSEENKISISKKLTGRKKSKETREKMSIARKGIILSKETREKISKSLSGSKSPNWKGGTTSKYKIIRRSSEYKSWRKACFLRDNFTCQKTGKSGGKLRCHHINNFSDFPELRTDIDNGITLSEESHILFHKIYGRKNNTVEQMKEFLNK